MRCPDCNRMRADAHREHTRALRIYESFYAFRCIMLANTLVTMHNDCPYNSYRFLVFVFPNFDFLPLNTEHEHKRCTDSIRFKRI